MVRQLQFHRRTPRRTLAVHRPDRHNRTPIVRTPRYGTACSDAGWPEWMLSLLQQKFGGDELKRHMGDLPGLEVLLHRLYNGRPSDRNRSLTAVKSATFKVLHEPPSNYGMNRATWTLPLLSKVLREIGTPACPDVIRTIARDAGYRWRKARVVLTSADPAYSAKLDRIHSILSGLQSDVQQSDHSLS